MDILAACLSGIIVKIYDDTTENGIITEGLLKESLHTLSCFLLAASSVGDFTYSVQLYAYNIVNHFANSEAFSELKEKSILYIYPVIILLSLPFIKRFSIPEVIVLIGSCILSFGEASTIKEDVSLRKLIMRLCLCVLIIFIVCFGLYFDVLSISLLKLCLFGLFYLLTSSAYQSYELFFKHFQVDIKVDESFFKELMQYKASNKA